jgi:type II secretory pathway component PulC
MRRLVVLASLLALGAYGCASPATAVSPGLVKAAPAPAPAPAQTADHRLARSAVHQVVSQGLGAFLQHVEVEDQPVMLSGRFHGFRIAVLRDQAFWSGVDLRPGDVVTGVNGFPIEHPEQAQTAFESLEVASELRVAYERDGRAREIVYAIVDDR